MRNVWRQRLPYYAYNDLHALLGAIKDGTTRQQRRELGVISEKEARLLLRVANFFNPRFIMQAGAATGVESVAMMAANSQSRLRLYDPQLEQKPLAVRVLQNHPDRVEYYDDVNVTVDELLAEAGTSRLALINVPVDEALLKRMLDTGAVIVLRNLNHDEAMWDLFDRCCDTMPMGQTYTNGKIAILNPNPKLQREDFLLWL